MEEKIKEIRKELEEIILKIHKANNNDELTLEFDKLAKILFNKIIIEGVNGKKYRITEIEFYFQTPCDKYHHDPYCYGTEFQKKQLCWYFHNSGLDITFGNKTNFGGVLIRSIIEINEDGICKDEEEYYGPLKTVWKLTDGSGQCIFNSPNFKLIEKILNNEKAWKMQRQLGEVKKEDNNRQYYDRKYRYFIFKDKTHSGKEKLGYEQVH